MNRLSRALTAVAAAVTLVTLTAPAASAESVTPEEFSSQLAAAQAPFNEALEGKALKMITVSTPDYSKSVSITNPNGTGTMKGYNKRGKVVLKMVCPTTRACWTWTNTKPTWEKGPQLLKNTRTNFNGSSVFNIPKAEYDITENTYTMTAYNLSSAMTVTDTKIIANSSFTVKGQTTKARVTFFPVEPITVTKPAQ